MKDTKSTFKYLTLISQFAINIMVPTFICLFIGLWISKFLGAWVVIPFLFLGMAAGMRNCYIMAMDATGDRKKEVDYDKQHKEDD